MARPRVAIVAWGGAYDYGQCMAQNLLDFDQHGDVHTQCPILIESQRQKLNSTRSEIRIQFSNLEVFYFCLIANI